MQNQYKGFSLFFEVKSRVLRAWNRRSVLINLVEQDRPRDLEEYYSRFPASEQNLIKSLSRDVFIFGEEAVRSKINRGMQA